MGGDVTEVLVCISLVVTDVEHLFRYSSPALAVVLLSKVLVPVVSLSLKILKGQFQTETVHKF